MYKIQVTLLYAHALSATRHTKLWKAADRQKSMLQLVWMRGQSRYGVAPWLENLGAST